MKIEVFQKLKNGKYKLKLEDGQEMIVYEDLILKYDLLLHKTITEELYKQIQDDNQKQESYYMALKYLKPRRRSKQEMIAYLTKQGFMRDMIEESIQKLEQQGYINDRDYASAYVQEQLLVSSKGPNKIRGELEKKGIDDRVISDALLVFDDQLQKEKVAKRIQKQIKGNRSKSNHVLKQKILQDCIVQGYEKEIILQELNDVKLQDDRAIKQKEYEKLYQKLQKKYQGKELEYKIRQKMYQKGFYDDER